MSPQQPWITQHVIQVAGVRAAPLWESGFHCEPDVFCEVAATRLFSPLHVLPRSSLVIPQVNMFFIVIFGNILVDMEL